MKVFYQVPNYCGIAIAAFHGSTAAVDFGTKDYFVFRLPYLRSWLPDGSPLKRS